MSAGFDEIEFRTPDYSSEAEMTRYLRLFWDIPLERNEYFTRRGDEGGLIAPL